jgi:hypothetical protein
MPLIASSEPPVLVSVSACGPLVVPTITTPKPRLAGVRPLEAKPGKIIVAVHAAIPSSWKTPRMLARMVW